MVAEERGANRIADAVVLVASLAFVAAAAWELTGTFDAGHDAASAAVGIAAVNSWRWGILAPVTHFTAVAPTPVDYYCHHPWGIFWTTALFVGCLGPHDWVLRLAPLLMSAATPPLVYLGARGLYGPLAGAVAALTFTVTPLALAFADFNALEVPVMFGIATAIWGAVRFAEGWRWRWLAVVLVGLGHAMNSDWAAFVFVAAALTHGLARLLGLGERWLPPLDGRRFAVAWVLVAVLAVAIGGGYVLAFFSLGQLERLLTQGAARTSGTGASLAAVLAGRWHWLELSFTPVGLALGALALPVAIGRTLGRRRDGEVVPLLVFTMALFQYLVFENGADVHVFWPHYFALYLAYGAGAIAATFRELAARVVVSGDSARGLMLRRWAPRLAVAAGIAPALVMVPDATATLTYARRTGKRFDDGWRRITLDGDKHAVAREVAARYGAPARVGVHPSMHPDWALEWALGREYWHRTQLAEGIDLLLLDTRFASAEVQAAIVRGGAVTAYGPFWCVARGAGAPIQALRITRDEPNFWRGYFVDGTDPRFGFEPDAHATWELRAHFGQSPNPTPATPPLSSEELRVSIGVALAAGDRAAAARHEGALRARLQPLPRVRLAGGSELVGFEVEGGVAPRLRVFVRAGARTAEGELRVVSRVDRRPWSTVAAPHRDREVGMPFAIPAPLWRAGWVYVAESELRRQPGHDEYSLEVAASPAGARQRIPLFRLP